MNTYRMRLATASAFAGLALLGAGCLGAQPTPPSETPPTPTPATTPPSPSAPPTTPPATTPPATSTPSGIELPAIDATWMTYTNRAETFSFRYPTKGRYAPTWEVLLPAKNDPKITNGCYSSVESIPSSEAPRTLTVNGVTFCHTRASDGFTGHIGYEDNFLAEVNGQWVLISFEKIVTNGSMYDAEQYPSCQGKYVTSPCVEFVEADYLAHLDQIVGTFSVLR